MFTSITAAPCWFQFFYSCIIGLWPPAASSSIYFSLGTRDRDNISFPFTKIECSDCGLLPISNCDDPCKLKMIQLHKNGVLFQLVRVAQLFSSPTTPFTTFQFTDKNLMIFYRTKVVKHFLTIILFLFLTALTLLLFISNTTQLCLGATAAYMSALPQACIIIQSALITISTTITSPHLKMRLWKHIQRSCFQLKTCLTLTTHSHS